MFIPAEIYHIVFDFIVTLLTIFYAMRYFSQGIATEETYSRFNWLPGFIIAFAFAIFIGLRPIHRIFVDMMNYKEWYYFSASHLDMTLVDDGNYIFDRIIPYFARHEIALKYFYLLISLVYFLCTYTACHKMFGNNGVYAFIAFLGAFSTFSYATNGIKAGAAGALFLCAIAYRKSWFKMLFFLFLTLGFHHAMILPIACLVLVWFVRDPRYYILFWLLCLAISFMQISYFQEIFASLSDESGSAYLTTYEDDWGGKTGFRWDFVLYSSFPIIVGLWGIYKWKLNSSLLVLLFDLYTSINAIWMLCMYVNFTNRIAYLSWILYPFLLVAPFFVKSDTHSVSELNLVVFAQLAFTLLMNYVYYG